MSRHVATALGAAFELKSLPRAGWSRVGIAAPESVAAHSWGMSLLILLLCPEELDRERAMGMAVVHDLAEVIVGDITPHDGVSPHDKALLEREAFIRLTEALPRKQLLRELWEEYEAAQTPTARFVKACDKLDMALQAAVYERTVGADTQEFILSAAQALPPGVLEALVPLEGLPGV